MARILLVEDDPAFVEVMEAACAAWGHRCEALSDGAEALERLLCEDYDVFVCDLHLPGLNGLELVDLVAPFLRGRTPIALVSAVDHLVSPLLENPARVPSGVFAVLRKGELSELGRMLTAALQERETYKGTVGSRLDRGVFQQRLRLAARRIVELVGLIRRDPLTDLPNRRALESDFQAPTHRRARCEAQFGFALCDLDRFKQVNARGYAAGDAALRRVAAILRQESRRGDSIFRYGGDEFVVLLDQMNEASATATMDRLRRAVEAAGLCTISVGLAMCEAHEPVSLEWLIREAGIQLALAKAAGGNCVRVACGLRCPT